MPNYGENIRARREALGISQVGLAEMIGETKQTIWKYESGTVTNIPLPKVEAIAKALHCSTEDITGWETKKEPTVLSTGELGEKLRKLSPEFLRILIRFIELAEANPESAERFLSFAVQELESSR